MKIVILGGGITGIVCAHTLIRDGHDVVIVERRDAPALETSYANAGQLSFGFASPWAAPGVPLKALVWMFKKDAPFILHPRGEAAMWSWLWRFAHQCTHARYARNKARLLKLAQYSQQCLHEILRDTPVAFDHQSRGILDLYRDAASLESAREDLAVLERFGIEGRLLDRDACIAVEPALASARIDFAGALQIARDETGDCRMFAQGLAKQLGPRATFHFDTVIEKIIAEGTHITRIVTNRDDITGDAYVVSLGSFSPALLRPLGLALPVYPVKGYSATVPITDENAAPVSTLTDEARKVGMTRLGNRLRIAGFAELNGHNLTIPDYRIAALINVAREWFPTAADYEAADPWTGLRPMTPDGAPTLGPTRYKNLILNTGHGTLGWTLSCASGRIVADLLAGRPSAIDIDDATLARFA